MYRLSVFSSLTPSSLPPFPYSPTLPYPASVSYSSFSRYIYFSLFFPVYTFPQPSSCSPSSSFLTLTVSSFPILSSPSCTLLTSISLASSCYLCLPLYFPILRLHHLFLLILLTLYCPLISPSVPLIFSLPQSFSPLILTPYPLFSLSKLLFFPIFPFIFTFLPSSLPFSPLAILFFPL